MHFIIYTYIFSKYIYIYILRCCLEITVFADSEAGEQVREGPEERTEEAVWNAIGSAIGMGTHRDTIRTSDRLYKAPAKTD